MQDLSVKVASSLFTSTIAKLSACPPQANSQQHKQTLALGERKE